ncbi:MAG: ABC transporter ATP-binding protein, partial [Clostridia bacterium]
MIKKFARYYAPYKKLFFADMFCAMVVSAVDLAFPQILRYVSGTLVAEGGSNIFTSIVYVALLMLGLYIVRYFCQYFITSWGHIMGAKMEGDMRQELFYHYQKLSFSYYDKNNTGEMISKLVNDLFDISELAHHGPENLLIASIKIIGSFVLLMTINVPITLILCAVTVIMLIFSIYMNKRMRRVFADNRKKIAVVNAKVQDSLLGIKVIKSFANEEVEHKKFDSANDAFFETKASSYKAMGLFHSVNSFLQGLLYIAALIAGGYFFATNDITAMDFAIYFIYIGIFINPLNLLINFTEMFQRGFSGFKRHIEVIETLPEIEDREDARDIIIANGEISYDNVHFSYDGDISVLNGIDLHIKSGETVALVGPSGGGKTTISSLLPRFYSVTSGSISIDGNDIRDFTLKSLRQAVGIVQQEVYIFGGTLLENI